MRENKKRYILVLLFFVNIIMLVVPVLPHHHHTGGVICMKQDIPVESNCPTHHHHDANDSCCKSECLTRFDSSVPSVQTNHGPHFVFTASLFADNIIVKLLNLPDKQQERRRTVYQESLHGTNVSRAFGLRAPPFTL